MELLDSISQSLQKGNTDEVATLTQRAVNDKVEPEKILDDGLIAGMAVVGERFKRHEIFLPDVLLAAKAMYAGIDILKPLFLETEMPTLGRVVIGTVQGDLHDIGKNLVGIMLKGSGFDVIDLGKDVSPEKFVDAAVERDAGVIGLSALLTTTRPVMKRVVELLKERELGDKIRVIIGGAPVSDEYAREIGADAYCFDGMKAVDQVKEYLGVK